MNQHKAIRVLTVALLLFVVYFAYSLIQRRDAHRRDRCIEQLRALEGAKEQFAIEHDGAAPARLEDLVPAYLHGVPACPSGGLYHLGDMQTGATCSVTAHLVVWP